MCVRVCARARARVCKWDCGPMVYVYVRICDACASTCIVQACTAHCTSIPPSLPPSLPLSLSPSLSPSLPPSYATLPLGLTLTMPPNKKNRTKRGGGGRGLTMLSHSSSSASATYTCNSIALSTSNHRSVSAPKPSPRAPPPPSSPIVARCSTLSKISTCSGSRFCRTRVAARVRVCRGGACALCATTQHAPAGMHTLWQAHVPQARPRPLGWGRQRLLAAP